MIVRCQLCTSKQQLVIIYIILKDGKLTTYLFLKTNFKLEKYLTLVKKYEYRKSISKLRTSAHRLFIETGRYTNIPEMKEYVKIVQIKKLKMKLTFSLDVQNLVERERWSFQFHIS